MKVSVKSKLPWVGTTIFTVMSALAKKHQAINLSQGFPNFDTSERLKELVSQYMMDGHNQYAPMTGLPQLCEQLANKIDLLYQFQVDPKEEITITAGATQAIASAITAFIHPGDEVILIEPAYDSYRPCIELAGGTAIPYELAAPGFRVNWQELGQLITPKTRMIIINTPHNPTGKILKEADLLALQQLTANSQILVLSDEVYEHLTYDQESHQSVLRYPELFQRSIITYSFGKTFHNTGWRMGHCVAPAHLMKEFRKVHQFSVFSLTTPIQYGIADYMKDPNVYLSLNDFYQEKRDYFADILKASRFKLLQCEGTYFQLADYSDISDESDTEFAKRMTSEFGVAVIPTSVFYSGNKDQKVIRFCFAKTKEVLEKAGDILINI